MKNYHLDPTKLNEQKRNIILLYSITLVVLVALNFIMYRGRDFNNSTYLVLGLMVVMFVFVGWSAIKQRNTLWDQFELTVDESGITQKQPKSATAFLPREELTEIKESKYGLTLLIKGGHAVMGIPKLLTPADYEEIKGIVNGWLQEAKPVVLDADIIEEAPESLLGEDPAAEPETPAVEEVEEPKTPDEPEA